MKGTATATAASRSVAAPVLPGALQRHLPELMVSLRRSALPTTGHVGSMAAYHLGWADAEGRPVASGAGKSLRGCLSLWTAEHCGGTATPALPAALAVEWVHNFSLVHDDIQDGDRERRFRPTVWAVYGVGQAINAGDGMHALAAKLLLEGAGSPGRRLRAAAAVHRAVLALIEGQCQDLALEGRLDASPAAYRRMATAKTGALMGAAMEAGAILGRASAGRARTLRRAGEALGLAFQIRDDWLGVWGDSSLTGKARGDLGRRKLSYPVVLALARLRGPARREFRRLFASEGQEDRLRQLLDESGASAVATAALDGAGHRVDQLVAAAGLTGAARREAGEIVDFVTRREV
ncbi:MAG: polyprenyl synthetase family protein [Candidatus Dormibacteria bacterium]